MIIDITDSKQKFKPGTVVYIKPNTNPIRSHSVSEVFAVVLYTYGSKYGNRIENSCQEYALKVKTKNGWEYIAWYPESSLELVEDENLCKEITADFPRG